MSSSEAKAFVRRHTTLRPVPGLDEIRLHLTDDILSLWRETQLASGRDEVPLPYWAIAWAGGIALTTYVRDHPQAVRDRRVLDLGSGSGLCAIAAAQAGAREVKAADVDQLAAAAIELNARANRVRIGVVQADLLSDDPPTDFDLVLAADCWYEATFAAKVTPWLRRAQTAVTVVLIGDPGRRYLPSGDLYELARYDARTTSDLENLDQKEASVYTFERGDL